METSPARVILRHLRGDPGAWPRPLLPCAAAAAAGVAVPERKRRRVDEGVATGVPVAPGIEALQQQLVSLTEDNQELRQQMTRMQEDNARNADENARRLERIAAALDVSDHASDDDAGVKK
eukprot:5429085-Prymnesium_polylepis.1